MSPAGEMWSVVTDSPTCTSTRAPVIAARAGGASVNPSKYGGFWMYVLLSFHRYRSLLETGTAFHVGFPLKTFAYSFLNCSGVTHCAFTACTSACVGQMFFK